MKYSKYNHTFFFEKKIILYNALSNAMMEISPDLLEILHKDTVQESDFPIECRKIYQDLIFAKVLTESDLTEFLKLKNEVLMRRYNPHYASFTILPTLDCNFNCPYCFETKKNIYLTSKKIQQISTFINNIISDKKSFNITWFGGEPLLGISNMQKIYSGLNTQGKNVHSSIITNGFLLNKKNIQTIKEINVSEVQITLDGLERTHNERKKLAKNNSINVFSKTIDNIINLVNEDFANVNIRVNIDNYNKSEFVPLMKFLSKKIPQIGKRVFIIPAFIESTENNNCNNEQLCLFSKRQIVDFVTDLYERSSYLHPIIYPGNVLYECPVRNVNSWVIGPDNSLYKCWEIVGRDEYKVGYINANGEAVITDERVLFQYLADADPINDLTCQECTMYPVCGGGCVHRRISHKKKIIANMPCMYAKENLESFLKLFYNAYQKKNS